MAAIFLQGSSIFHRIWEGWTSFETLLNLEFCIFYFMNGMKSFSICDLPAEIRIFIFRECLTSNGLDERRSPDLIRALRGDQQLHHEVLNVFYSEQTFSLSAYIQKKIKLIPPEALRTVQPMKGYYIYANLLPMLPQFICCF